MIIALILATALLVAIPGPNVALIIANSIRYGFRFGFVTVLGTTIGLAVQLFMVIFGLTLLISIAADILTWVKWAGIVYLLYLAFQTWSAPEEDLSDAKASDKSAGTLFWQGLGLAIVNPKTLIFNAAFLPQFVTPDQGAFGLAIVASVYLAVLLLGDSLWALSAHYVRLYVQKFPRIKNRLVGLVYAGGGAGLAMAQVEK